MANSTTFLLSTGSTPGKPQQIGQVLALGVRPNWVEQASLRGVEPASAEIVVTDKGLRHTFRDTKLDQLDRDWFARLPEHLRSPRAVLLDKNLELNSLLLVFDMPGSRVSKLVVTINYRIKGVEGPRNVITIGRPVSIEDLRAQISKGGVELIEGEL